MKVNYNEIFEYPMFISWEITPLCNYRCIHCRMEGESSDKVYTNDELTLEEVKKQLDELCELGIQQINYSGGEPFCRKDFIEILEYTSNKGFKIGITTNGSFIDDAMASKLAKIKNIDLVQISLDGKDPETHDFIRGIPGAFRQALQAIENLKKNGIRTGAVTTVMKYNKKQVQDILQLLLDLKVDCYGARRFMPVGRGSQYIDSLVVNVNDYYNHCKQWVDFVEKYREKIQLYIEEPLLGIFEEKLKKYWTFSGCVGGSIYGAIMANGEVRPCIFLPISLGSIREKSFSEVWKNPLRKLFDKTNLNEECEQCHLKEVCGGCRAMAYLVTGDIKAKDPLCFKDL